MKRLIPILLVLGLCWVGSGWAAPSAQALVKETADKMMATLKTEKEHVSKDPQRIYQLVNEIVLPHFDFVRMAKRVLGKYWRDATPAQRQGFTEAFRDLLVKTYANSLTEYTDRKITYLPAREPETADAATVRSEVELASGNSVEISYRLAQEGAVWKVYDVTIDGVSLVTNYRSSFSREIDQGGLDSLIKKLVAQNAQAADGKQTN